MADSEETAKVLDETIDGLVMERQLSTNKSLRSRSLVGRLQVRIDWRCVTAFVVL